MCQLVSEGVLRQGAPLVVQGSVGHLEPLELMISCPYWEFQVYCRLCHQKFSIPACWL